MKNIKYRLANLLGLNTDASLFEINHDEIQKTNLLFLQQISFTSGLIMLLLYLVSLVLPSIADLRMTYFMEFLVSAIIFVLTCVAFDALLPYSLVLTYFLTSVIMAYGAIAGIYQTPEGTATAFIVLISFCQCLYLINNPMFCLFRWFYGCFSVVRHLCLKILNILHLIY